MAVTATSFKTAFPEFANADNTLVAAVITRAAADCPADTWGDLTDRGVELVTAQALALSPNGRGTQLVNKDGSTVYDQRLIDLKRAVTLGGVTIAGEPV